MTKNSFQVICAVGKVTFSEVVRDKVLYNILLGAMLIFGVGFLASQLSFIRPERIVTDFGVSAVNLSGALLAIFTGSALLGREFDRRTIYVALAHPISRQEFLLGKYFGLSIVLWVNGMLMTMAATIIVVIIEGGFSGVLNDTYLKSMFLLQLQSFLLGSISLFFSSFSTTSLAAIMSLGIYLVGNNISEIRGVAVKSQSETTKWILNFISQIFPNFEHFNVGTKVTYALPVSNFFVGFGLLYFIGLAFVFLLMAGFFLQKKEV